MSAYRKGILKLPVLENDVPTAQTESFPVHRQFGIVLPHTSCALKRMYGDFFSEQAVRDSSSLHFLCTANLVPMYRKFEDVIPISRH